MVYINKDTFEIYNNLIGLEEEVKNYFECDEFIANTIQSLNAKGYRTNFCCAGHVYPEKQKYKGIEAMIYFNPYVSFTNIYDFETIPKNFYLSKDKKSLHIDFEDVELYEERKEQILKALNDLYDWALNLPVNSGGKTNG